MLKHLDHQAVKQSMELVPGGDIRIGGNQWMRVAWRESGLCRVPREQQVREAVRRVVKKGKLRFHLSCFCITVVWNCLDRVYL